MIRRIIEGGESVCTAAGIPIAGGHTIDSVEPIYGLVALGPVHPKKVKKNSAARAGDVLVLGKPLGVGVYSAALKKEQLDATGYAQMIPSTTQLNTPGRWLPDPEGVHALTDVTGFGLLGHLLEVARGARLHARIRWADVPLLPGVPALAAQGFVICSKDDDFQRLVAARGWRPRLVRLALGNVGNDAVLAALLGAADRLEAAFEDPAVGVAVIE